MEDCKFICKISHDICELLLNYLDKITITLNKNKMGRAQSFGEHRSITLGIVKSRRTRRYGLSRLTHKFPELFKLLTDISMQYFPEYEFNAIHVNKNVVCPPHIDKNNIGPSIIFSIGNYQGCDLNCGGVSFNTHEHALLFKGNKSLHYNTPLLSGTKYSFVFFMVLPV